MLVVLLLILTCAIIVLNFSAPKSWRVQIPKTQKKPARVYKEYKVPVARKFSVLYWYFVLGVLSDVIPVLWEIIYKHPWSRFTASYVAQHNLHASIQFLKVQDFFVVLLFPAFLIILRLILIISKREKDVISVLKLLLGWDILQLLSDILRHSPSGVESIFFVLFTSLILWSITKDDMNFFGIFKSKH